MCTSWYVLGKYNVSIRILDDNVIDKKRRKNSILSTKQTDRTDRILLKIVIYL